MHQNQEEAVGASEQAVQEQNQPEEGQHPAQANTEVDQSPVPFESESKEVAAPAKDDPNQSRDVKIFDESQEMETQITRKSVPLNPLKPDDRSPKLEKQQSMETPDKPLTNYDASSFNTSMLNDLNNMSMVSFNLESTQQLGLGEFGQSIILDDVNLMQIKETL